MKALENDASILDRFYIPTRYPDGLPDLTPSEAYIREDAEGALLKSRNIIDKIKKIISENKS